MKYTILEAQAKQKYVLDLLKETPILGDTSFVSLSVFLNQLKEKNRTELWFISAKVLNDLVHSGELKILNSILSYPVSVDQVLVFIQRMAEEGWTLADLPQGTLKEKDLYRVVEVLMPYVSTHFDQWRLFEKKDDFSSVSFLEHFYRYPIHNRLTEAQNRGLKKIHMESYADVEKGIRFSNNPRSEAQSVAQMLAQSEMAYEDQSIVCLDPKQMDLVEVFLSQYGIPVQKVGVGKVHPAFRFFSDILKFKEKPDLESFITLIHNDGLSLSYKVSLIQYLEQFRPDLTTLWQKLSHVESAFNVDALNDLLTKALFINLEKEAELGLTEIGESIQALVDASFTNIEEMVSVCFDFMMSRLTLDDETLSAVLVLKEHLENASLSSIEKLENRVDYIVHSISSLRVSSKAQTGILLTDLSHAFIPGLKRQIWLGCTQNNYPQFKTNDGLFDDDYIQGIRSYDLKAEYEYHMSMLDRLQTIAPSILYSYALGTFEGKAQRMPYELESVLKGHVETMMWPLVEHDSTKDSKTKTLEADVSQALYFKDGLKGSITSFENYFKCPYKYFLRKGLGLKEDEDLEVNQLTLGNLIHVVLEKGVQRYGKNYPEGLKLHLDEHIEPYLSALIQLFPHNADALKLMSDKTKEVLSLSLNFLASREQNTEYEPYEVEHEFDFDFPLESESIHFKGKIDRMDCLTKDGIVIDYKSSPTTISEEKFLAGLKLQLPTYIWVLQHLGLSPKGAFYFSLSPEKIELRSDPDFDVDSEEIRVRRLKGMIFEKDSQLDPSAKHIVGFKANDKGGGFPRAFHLELTLEELKSIYSVMVQGLREGNLKKQNKDGACTYCSYKHFCQYKGPYEKVPIVKVADTKVRP